jgi:hypothetical protein
LNAKTNQQLDEERGQSKSKTKANMSHQRSISSAVIIKEEFLRSALQLLANIMQASFQIYLEFVKNYSKSMTILNKFECQLNNNTNIHLNQSSSGDKKLKKSFIECQYDFIHICDKLSNQNNKTTTTTPLGNNNNLNIYYSDDKNSKSNRRQNDENKFDTAKIFGEEILRRPTKLYEFIYSLKDECSLAANELPPGTCKDIQACIKSLFDNEQLKVLREDLFDQINRNIMPKEVRKRDDVVELLVNHHDERKLRHLILYGDCLVCCKIKK